MATATAERGLEAVIYGPTWRRDEAGKIVLPPQRSLGWRGIEWCEDWLLQPDGPKAGQGWRFTKEQKRFFCWWYALDDDNRFVYRTGTLRRSKGTGKNPFAMALCLFELIGPCRPTGEVDDRGFPVGEAQWSALVQSAAVNLTQTQNAMSLTPAMLSKHAIREYDMDVGKEKSYANQGRCLLQAVTSSPRALEGARTSFVVMDETHHWLRSNEGHAMAEVITRNATKSRGGTSRRLAITNAHAPGEDSVAEHDFEAWKKVEQGLAEGTDMLYDSIEPPEIDINDDEAVKRGLEIARGDADWLDPVRILAEIRDPRTPPGQGRRFYLNQIVAEEDKPFDSAKFADLERKGFVPAPRTLITLGFDGSLTRDHTALWGTEIESGVQFKVGYWEPREQPDGTMAIDFAAVDQTVDDAFERYQVWRMYADPYKWGAYLSSWAGKYGADRVVSWSTTTYKKMAHALAQYRIAIERGDLGHDGAKELTAAIANAHKHMQAFRDDDGELMWVIQKERPDSPLKIDAAMAAVLSWQARCDAVAAGVKGRGDALDPSYLLKDRHAPEMAGARNKEF